MTDDELLLTPKERKKIEGDWFKSLPRGDGKLPRDLELEAQLAKCKRLMKVKLPKNPYIHTPHINPTFPCKACIWEEAIRKTKELNPEFGREEE